MTMLSVSFKQSFRAARTLADCLNDLATHERIDRLEAQADLAPDRGRDHILAELLLITDALQDRLDRGY